MLNSQTIEGVRIMAGSNEAEVFDMDTFEEGERGVEPSGQGGAEAASSDRVELGESGRYDGSIELSRRAIPVLQVDEDVCSICLDEFVDDDPGFSTTCGHLYHLQCIMQWAQRSRECPLCFKALGLQDPDMNALLPFGEYVPPERYSEGVPHFMLGLEAWELERLLQRLAVTNSASSSRRPRTRGRSSRAYSLPGSRIGGEANGLADQASSHAGSSAAEQSTQEHTSTSNSNGGHIPPEAEGFPSSWPPSSSKIQQSAETGGGMQRAANMDIKTPAENIKSRWSSLQSKWKESFSKTTHDLKGRWGRHQPPASSSDVASSHNQPS